MSLHHPLRRLLSRYKPVDNHGSALTITSHHHKRPKNRSTAQMTLWHSSDNFTTYHGTLLGKITGLIRNASVRSPACTVTT